MFLFRGHSIFSKIAFIYYIYYYINDYFYLN